MDYSNITQIRSLANEVDRLRTPRPLREFSRIVDQMSRRFPCEMLLAGNRGKPWREAWIAREFGVMTKARRLKLATANQPSKDFYMKRGAEPWRPYEVTEALLNGRKRDDEIKSGVSTRTESATEIQHQSDGALPALLGALGKKARKSRGSRVIVYWNTGWLVGADEFIQALETQTKSFRDEFAEAWIIGKGSLFRVAPDFVMIQGPPISLGSGSTTRVLDDLYD